MSDKKQSVSSNRSKLMSIKEIKTLNDYDFIDLGGGDGASLINIERIIGGKGIAVEFDEVKVKKAQDLKRMVYFGNALDLHKIHGKVSFVTCDNFLEHLNNFNEVKNMLQQSMRVAKDFIYIRHPSFDNIEYINSLGLKTYWSHWHGHKSMLKISDFVDMFIEMGIEEFKVVPVGRIKDSSDDRILPLDAPIDQHNYEPSKHGKKPKNIKFDEDIFYAFDIIAMLPGTQMSLPTLHYHDRLGLAKHPIFTLNNHTDAIKMLNAELKKIQSRRSIRLTNTIRQVISKIKSIY